MDRANSLPSKYAIDWAGVPWIEPAERVAQPIVAICDLLRFHAVKVGCKDLIRIDPDHVQEFLCREIHIKPGGWEWSLTGVVDRLSGALGDVYRIPPADDTSAGGQDEEVALVGGFGLERLEGRDVPRAEVILKWAISSGLPVAVGIGITEDFDDLKSVTSGEVRIPRPQEVIGDGTCLILMGWDESIHCFAVRGTFGVVWGSKGYGWLPYQYVTNPLWCHEAVVVISV